MVLNHPSQKKLKETISASSMSDKYAVSLDNEDCTGILLDSLKNLEKEVLVDQNRQTQIKGELSFVFQSQSNLSPISLTNMKKNVRKKIKL